MSRGARLGLIAAAVAVAVAAFVVARPGGDDEPPGAADGESPRQPLPPGQVTEIEPTATAPSAPDPPADGPAPAPAERIELRGHTVAGGPATIEVARGERVRLVVASDAPDDIHVHGYDIERSVAPGEPARLSFPATIEGIFEVESHEAEHAGADPLIARLVVEPS